MTKTLRFKIYDYEVTSMEIHVNKRETQTTAELHLPARKAW